MCIGIHLATMELKMILATILDGRELSVGERTTDHVMGIADHFVLMAKGGFCELYPKRDPRVRCTYIGRQNIYCAV
jgi:hypothetical protein